MRRGRDLREAQDRGAAEAQATILAGAVIPMAARAGGGGRLFGSIGPADVAEAIKAAARAWKSTASTSSLAEPIKEVGSFDITVELFDGRGHRGDPGGHSRLLSWRYPRVRSVSHPCCAPCRGADDERRCPPQEPWARLSTANQRLR